MADRPARHATFVVRVSRDDADQVTGVVICVRTGERLVFRDVGDVGLVLIRAIADEMPPSTEAGSSSGT
jgi:hypothetical protein